jgi:beta-1,4-mannosyltransferase
MNEPSPRSNRPALLVSSTSWTPDEDFSILTEALTIYERRAIDLNRSKAIEGQLPKILMVVTGKGPLRAKYMKEFDILQSGWEWVRCVSLWLEATDYPLLLGSNSLPHVFVSTILYVIVIRISRSWYISSLEFLRA